MPSSESEDFESADEGTGNVEKKERKKRHSSSNYSDNALENDPVPLKTPVAVVKKVTNEIKQPKQSDGWDDFEIDEEESPPKVISKSATSNMEDPEKLASNKVNNIKDYKKSGWDDFDDWSDSTETKEPPVKPQPKDKDVKEVTNRLAATSVSTPTSSGWGWGGWGVDSLLSSATAGINSITNQVSQGFSTVIETGIGIPEPEELAKQTTKDKNSNLSEGDKPDSASETADTEKREVAEGGDGAFDFGSILKFVGNTGSKVITGGLDTLETIGRKTMEVLQDGDPGLEKKKRAMMGFFDPDKPILSQVLREAKSKAEEEDKIKEEKREAKQVHYENLFDDFEGLVHLEALEMLSKQVSMRIEERVQSASPSDRQDIKETLQQVAELCEMPDEEDEEEERESLSDLSKPEALLERLQRATKDLGVKLQFQTLIKQYTEILEYMNDESNDFTDKTMYKKAISNLAQATAISVEIYHKAAEMLLVKPRRSTADEADGLTQLTAVLTKHTTDVATVFTQKMDKAATYVNATDCNNCITNIFLEAGNSATYIQNAFQLTQPIVQIGAI